MTRRKPFNSRIAQARARQVLNRAIAEAGVRTGWLELTTIWPSIDDVTQRYVMYVYDLVPSRSAAPQTLVREVLGQAFLRIDGLSADERQRRGDRPYYREFAGALLASANHIAGFRGYAGGELVWDPRLGPVLPVLLLRHPSIELRTAKDSVADQYAVHRALFRYLFLPEQFPFIQRLLCLPPRPLR